MILYKEKPKWCKKKLLIILFMVCITSIVITICTTSNIRKTANLFLNEVSIPSYSVYQESNVQQAVLIAIAMVESDNGNSFISKEGKNLFSMKVNDDWKGNVIEVDGIKYKKYSSYYESFLEFSQYLQCDNNLTQSGFFETTSSIEQIELLKKNNYIINETYYKNILGVIDEYLLDTVSSKYRS